MPSTVNGIGTSYFLKKDRCFSVDHCENCGNLTWLSDYTTYKCICVLFIPLIPYGKARVVDYCPACTRHHVIPYNRYTEGVTESLQEAKQAWQADPQNSETVIALCNVMIATGHADQIDELLRVTHASLSQMDKAIVDLRRLIANKQGHEALAAYETLVAQYSGEGGLVIEMLQMMFLMGRKKEIGAAISNTFNANLDSVYFMSNAGDLANFAKDFETAANCYDRLFALKPELIAELSRNKAVRKAYKKAGRPFPGQDV